MTSCCPSPFPVMNVTTNINQCRNCSKSWSSHEACVYTCPYCKIPNVETTCLLDLEKHGATNWTECEKCGMEVQYTEKTITQFLS